MSSTWSVTKMFNVKAEDLTIFSLIISETSFIPKRNKNPLNKIRKKYDLCEDRFGATLLRTAASVLLFSLFSKLGAFSPSFPTTLASVSQKSWYQAQTPLFQVDDSRTGIWPKITVEGSCVLSVVNYQSSSTLASERFYENAASSYPKKNYLPCREVPKLSTASRKHLKLKIDSFFLHSMYVAEPSEWGKASCCRKES